MRAVFLKSKAREDTITQLRFPPGIAQKGMGGSHGRYPVPTGPPIPTVKERSEKSLPDNGKALWLKNPGE